MGMKSRGLADTARHGAEDPKQLPAGEGRGLRQCVIHPRDFRPRGPIGPLSNGLPFPSSPPALPQTHVRETRISCRDARVAHR